MAQIKRITATGDVAVGTKHLLGAVLTPAAAASTLDIRDGSGGAIVASLAAAANGASVPVKFERPGVLFSSSIHATIAGASASATFEYA